VGAGAVVRGRVPDYAVVAGNPARVLRMRFTDTEIATLMRLAWWDWPQARIEAAADALMAGDVSALEAHAP
jgi:virginiamycin A acetyltransferase